MNVVENSHHEGQVRPDHGFVVEDLIMAFKSQTKVKIHVLCENNNYTPIEPSEDGKHDIIYAYG